jgi:hypothetical protein
VLKTRLTLKPGANGTKRLVERYGARLLCVRYRYDTDTRKRLKTVELIEEEMPWLSSAALYLLKIGYEETELRERLKLHGARWDRQRKVWITSAEVVRRLHLQERVCGWLELG